MSQKIWTNMYAVYAVISVGLGTIIKNSCPEMDTLWNCGIVYSVKSGMLGRSRHRV